MGIKACLLIIIVRQLKLVDPPRLENLRQNPELETVARKARQHGVHVHYNFIKMYIRILTMKQATFTEIRNHAKQYFDIVESGESVRVIRNGKPIADIVPVMADVPSWKRRKAQPLVLDGVAVSQMILQERQSNV